MEIRPQDTKNPDDYYWHSPHLKPLCLVAFAGVLIQVRSIVANQYNYKWAHANKVILFLL